MDHLTKGKTCIGNCTFFKLENIKQLLGLGPGNSREFPEKILSFILAGIPYAKFMFFYATRK